MLKEMLQYLAEQATKTHGPHVTTPAAEPKHI